MCHETMTHPLFVYSMLSGPLPDPDAEASWGDGAQKPCLVALTAIQRDRLKLRIVMLLRAFQILSR